MNIQQIKSAWARGTRLQAPLLLDGDVWADVELSAILRWLPTFPSLRIRIHPEDDEPINSSWQRALDENHRIAAELTRLRSIGLSA